MPFTVKIRQFDDPVSVGEGQTILEAALAHGLPYPHGCRSGNCGSCKSELLSGKADLQPYSEFALTEEERQRGLILACRAVALSDCEVAYLGLEEIEVPAVRKVACRVTGIVEATHDIRIVRMEAASGGPFEFLAGQYAGLSFGDLPPRDFSMANRPDEPTLEFHIRLMPEGTVSPYVATALKLGEEVMVEGPYGTSFLREAHTGPVIAVAGGSGLAPIKSIVEMALKMGKRQGIYLYFGGREERDIYLEDHFKRLVARHPNLHFITVLSEPAGPTKRRSGLLADVVAQDFGDLDGCKAYLAGPPIMVETTTEALVDLELRSEDCHADAFYTEAEKVALESSS